MADSRCLMTFRKTGGDTVSRRGGIQKDSQYFRENDTEQNPGLHDSMECQLEAQTI